MIIQKFDKTNLDTVSDEMMKALKEVGDKFGIDFSRKSLRYTDGDFRVSVVAKVVNRAEGVLTKEEVQYNFERQIDPSLPELGSSFISDRSGKKLTIVGWNTRARKYPIMMKDEDGRGYKDSPSRIKTVAFI